MRRALRVRSLLLSFLLASVAAAVEAPSASAQSRVRTSVDTTHVTVGDRVMLAVSVDHAEGAVVAWPDSIDLAPFEVVEARLLPSEPAGDRVTSAALFSLAAFELGELEIPSFELTVLLADGSSETLSTDRYGVEVVSVGQDESGDIREIRGPLSIPIGALRVALWGLLFMLLGAVTYALLRRIRARPSEAESPKAGPPPRPPHEIALEALASLEASPLLETGRVKEYHIEVSDILRRYVEARFDVMALEMTTWEVLEGLDAAAVAGDFRDGLRSFLERCDLVKFAKARPSQDASRAVLSLGRELVEQSVPPPPSPPSESGSESGSEAESGSEHESEPVGATD